ncbi:DUF92 domain-containing protein [Thermococcus peptonophilus]|uniref:TIGR00297 family protein n=1 Tax=Thermococcus peptonophilus TaxID=53952 RepID=A0A142CWS4_9EURY|nr:hypothetical protein A0127_08640 [Thermococcus peptonophilus]
MTLNIIADIITVLLLGILAYRSRALDANGSVAAGFLGLGVLVFGGIWTFLALLVFLILGVLATKYKYKEKVKKGLAQPNNGTRGLGNVLGNGLAVLIFLLIETAVKEDIFWAATFASIATVNGDTLASELGKILGRRPRLITNLKPVTPGTDGAVSLQGEIIALIGALIIALFALPLTTHTWEMILAVTVGGFIGVNIDSLIGATLEEKGITDNNSTNFLASLFGGLIGAALFYALEMV